MALQSGLVEVNDLLMQAYETNLSLEQENFDLSTELRNTNEKLEEKSKMLDLVQKQLIGFV